MQLLDSDFTFSYRVNSTAKQLPNFSDYIILPNEGLIWSKKSNRFIGYKQPSGYYHTTLYDDNGIQVGGNLHRFIYEAVYGPIPEGMDVNHIDENKSNNSIFNLNLMTHKDNCNWGTRNERVGKAVAKALTNGMRSKPVGGYIGGELKITFPSASEAGRNGFKQSAVWRCCQGERNFHKGYEWRYLEN